MKVHIALKAKNFFADGWYAFLCNSLLQGCLDSEDIDVCIISLTSLPPSRKVLVTARPSVCDVDTSSLFYGLCLPSGVCRVLRESPEGISGTHVVAGLVWMVVR